MPKVDAHLHYRLIDVSSFKEVAKRWNKPVVDAVKKSGAHTALEDIQESISEMRHYKQYLLISA